MKVLVYNEQRDVPIRKLFIKTITKEVLTYEGCSTNEVSIYFVTAQEICRLHQEFFNDPSLTDCITFPLDNQEESNYHILGEIFICPKAALEYDALKVENEIALYLVHGLLHLLGYDDVNAKTVKQMRLAETRHMERLMAKKLLSNL